MYPPKHCVLFHMATPINTGIKCQQANMPDTLYVWPVIVIRLYWS